MSPVLIAAIAFICLFGSALALCALAVSGAIFVTLEMYTPFQGVVQLSSAPLRQALAHLGH